MSRELASDIAGEVRAEISRQKRAQRDIADLLDLSQAQVSDRVNGVVEWRISELVLVADWLGVSITKFVPFEEPVGGAA